MELQVAKPKKPNYPVKVMWISNSANLPTGYAKVTREICYRLSNNRNYEVYTVGMQSQSSQQYRNFYILGVNKDKPAESIQKHVDNIRPDVVILLEDSFTATRLELHNLQTYNAPLLFYVPMDGNHVPTTGSYMLRRADYIISMSEFSKNVLDKEGYDSEVIWHGVNRNLFYPISDEEKRDLKQKHGFNRDDFIMFSFFRNSARKSPQALLQALTKVLNRRNNKTKALVHCLKADMVQNDLYDYMQRIAGPLYGKVMNEQLFISDEGLNDDEIAELVRMADVSVSASTGEGFGLLMTESMACGNPVIHNAYTTPHELVTKHYIDSEGNTIGERGLVVEPKLELVGSYNVAHGHIDPDDLAKAINKYLNMKKEDRQKMSENSKRFVDEYLGWDRITQQFSDKIQKVI